MARPPILRVARPTSDIAALLGFYRDGLGFEQLGAFADHDGFDGIMLGHREWPYHLEFTCQRGHPAALAPSKDNLLVFYMPDADAWSGAVRRMADAGFAPVASLNPYWDERGRTFEDPDGYRIVFENAESPV